MRTRDRSYRLGPAGEAYAALGEGGIEQADGFRTYPVHGQQIPGGVVSGLGQRCDARLQQCAVRRPAQWWQVADLRRYVSGAHAAQRTVTAAAVGHTLLRGASDWRLFAQRKKFP